MQYAQRAADVEQQPGDGRAGPQAEIPREGERRDSGEARCEGRRARYKNVLASATICICALMPVYTHLSVLDSVLLPSLRNTSDSRVCTTRLTIE